MEAIGSDVSELAQHGIDYLQGGRRECVSQQGIQPPAGVRGGEEVRGCGEDDDGAENGRDKAHWLKYE
jgi:hypothetical protein